MNGGERIGKDIVAIAIPVLLGAAAFLLVVGPRVLSPMNIGWLDGLGGGDPATHYLGWQFFRNSSWSFPVGLNPSYGLELSNAIVFSDSNPLLAILFKFFSPLLSQPFQYFGWWFLACFILQALFGWKIIGLISESKVIRSLGTSLFVFAPPMLTRLQVHPSLVGHFLVVAALYLALRPMQARRSLHWGILLTVTALVHPYLLAMVAALWLADLLGRMGVERLSVRHALSELGSLALIVGFVCWQAGYFSVSGGLTDDNGYGRFRMNMLSVIDPSGWSYVLRDSPEAISDGDGFNYLGLGIICFLYLRYLPQLVAASI